MRNHSAYANRRRFQCGFVAFLHLRIWNEFIRLRGAADVGEINNVGGRGSTDGGGRTEGMEGGG